MKERILTLLAALVSAIAIGAQESQTAYNFLRLPVSAHGVALGGYNISVVEDDPSLAFANPALLSSVSDKTLSLNGMTFMKGAVTASAMFNRVATDKLQWAVGAQYVDYGSMKETDENNQQTGDFSARDISVQGFLSYQLARDLVGGITLKFINSYIGSYSSMAVGVDLGLNYYNPDIELSLSAVAKNLGGQVKAFEDDFEKMPFDLQVGGTKQLGATPFRLSATLVDLTHWDYKFINHVALGLDAILGDNFWLGLGYNFRRKDEMSITSADGEESSHSAGLTLGGGLLLEKFKLNVAYSRYHVSSNALIINLAYSL